MAGGLWGFIGSRFFSGGGDNAILYHGQHTTATVGEFASSARADASTKKAACGWIKCCPNDIEDVHNTETRSEYSTLPRKEGLTTSQHELFLPSVLTN